MLSTEYSKGEKSHFTQNNVHRFHKIRIKWSQKIGEKVTNKEHDYYFMYITSMKDTKCYKREKKALRQSMNKLTPISQIKEASSCFSKSYYKKLHLTTYRLIVAYGYIIYLIVFYWDE